MVADFPYDIKKEVVRHLLGHPRALRIVCEVSRGYFDCARPFTFRRIEILTISKLQQLAQLLVSVHCTIPFDIDALIINLQDQERELHGLSPLHYNTKVTQPIARLLWYFHASTARSLNIPWTINRILVATHTGDLFWRRITNDPMGSLKSLVLSGTYSRLQDAVDAISHLSTLEDLAVHATWKDDLITNSKKLQTSLQTLSLSASSLGIMSMAGRYDGGRHLKGVRLMVDGSLYLGYANQTHRFFQKFGLGLIDVCFCFEAVPVYMYEFIGASIRQTLEARSAAYDSELQVGGPEYLFLELCFPSLSLEEAQTFADIVGYQLSGSRDRVVVQVQGIEAFYRYAPFPNGSIYRRMDTAALAELEDRTYTTKIADQLLAHAKVDRQGNHVLVINDLLFESLIAEEGVIVTPNRLQQALLLLIDDGRIYETSVDHYYVLTTDERNFRLARLRRLPGRDT